MKFLNIPEILLLVFWTIEDSNIESGSVSEPAELVPNESDSPFIILSSKKFSKSNFKI